MHRATQKMIFGGGSFGIVNFFSRGDTPSMTKVSHGTLPVSVMVSLWCGAGVSQDGLGFYLCNGREGNGDKKAPYTQKVHW